MVIGLLDDLTACTDRVATLCQAIDPAEVELDEVAQLHGVLVRLGKLAAGAQLRLAARVAQSQAWKQAGARTPADYLAHITGTTKRQARDTLEASGTLAAGGLAATDQAVRDGQLSAEQTSAVVEAAAADPDAEPALLDTAVSQPVRVLRDQARDTIAAADPTPEQTRQRAHARRALTSWVEPGQVGVVQLRTTADLLADFNARLRPEVERVFRHARKAGSREPEAAYAHDALFNLLTNATDGPAERDRQDAGKSRRRRRASRGRESKIIALADATALKRGYLLPGETCEIAGRVHLPHSMLARRRRAEDALGGAGRAVGGAGTAARGVRRPGRP